MKKLYGFIKVIFLIPICTLIWFCHYETRMNWRLETLWKEIIKTHMNGE